MIEKNFEIAFVADLALREKQVQQSYRPVIAVHKWFARRPGTMFRALLLSEFGGVSLRQSFFKCADLSGFKVADPFMGGGTPLLEANRMGCDVLGFDINPMAYWIVREEMEHLDLASYRRSASELRSYLEKKIGRLYRTHCMSCGSDEARVKYFLWVKMQPCPECGRNVDLFPGYLLAEDQRHPQNVLVCWKCGELNECLNRRLPGRCQSCRVDLKSDGLAKRGHCVCRDCGTVLKYPDGQGPLKHRMFAIEYHCSLCKGQYEGRFFKKPDPTDLARVTEAEQRYRRLDPVFIPDDKIPTGDETGRLHRWGYDRYEQMFNVRQLVGLELSCEFITKVANDRVRSALATNLSDLLRYQNMLCRYDTMALKSLDIFSVHGFPVGLVQCESNLLGIPAGPESSVGSGGWANIIAKYSKAKRYCDDPFEVRVEGGRKTIVVMRDEWIGEQRSGLFPSNTRTVDLRCADAAKADIQPASLDAVLTDPPYFGNVQYAELMDFCYVWLRRLVGQGRAAFEETTTRNQGELTGNEDMNRSLAHFTEGLSAVFQKMAIALKPGRPLAFTYHHNKIEAYYPIAVAILDSGLECTAVLPCPAEMGASIHISGTESSIIDSIFVCRSSVVVSPRVDRTGDLEELLRADLQGLLSAGVRVTPGDVRCVAFGQFTRFTIHNLRTHWMSRAPTEQKLHQVERSLETLAPEAWLGDFLKVWKTVPITERIPARTLAV